MKPQRACTASTRQFTPATHISSPIRRSLPKSIYRRSNRKDTHGPNTVQTLRTLPTMNHPRIYIEPEQLDANADLHTVLTAWHVATLRLEQTHEALRQEVRRLTNELEDKNRELARKNRLADLGQMASHVAHEVRNSLVPVTLYLSLLRRRLLEDPVARELLDKLAAGFTSLDATVNDLLNFTAQR